MQKGEKSLSTSRKNQNPTTITDLITLKSIVTSALEPLTLDTKIPITVSVVEAGTASIISAVDVPRTP